MPSASHRQPSSSTHLIVTRSSNVIFKPHHFSNFSHLSFSPIHQALFFYNEPNGYKSTAKNPKWLEAMSEDMVVLHKNDTWVLVPHPIHTSVVGSKWGFRSKIYSDGIVDRFKAHLVA